jgi:type II secretory pathway pseudopilin PulG
MRARSGFTLIELLIAANLSMLLLNLMLMSLSIIQKTDIQIDLRQNLNGIIQLRQKLALCQIKKVSEKQVACLFNQIEYDFSLEKNRLIMSPGYVVYLEKIENASFEKKDQVLGIRFTVQGEEINAVLAYIE